MSTWVFWNPPQTHRRERHRPSGRRPRPETPSSDSGMDMDVDQDAPVIPPVVPERPVESSALPSELEPQPEPQPEPEPPVYFYDRHEPYFEFTNFASYSVKYDRKRYPTAEHLFQAHKFLETEPHLAEHIRRQSTPRAALQEATRLRSRQRRDWFDVNVGFMDMILDAKFRQHEALRNMLLATRNRELIERSPVDSFWGTGADGRGRNELGKALMRLRDRFRAEERREG